MELPPSFLNAFCVLPLFGASYAHLDNHAHTALSSTPGGTNSNTGVHKIRHPGPHGEPDLQQRSSAERFGIRATVGVAVVFFFSQAI